MLPNMKAAQRQNRIGLELSRQYLNMAKSLPSIQTGSQSAAIFRCLGQRKCAASMSALCIRHFHGYALLLLSLCVSFCFIFAVAC